MPGSQETRTKRPDPRLSPRAMRIQMAGMGLEFVSVVLGGLALGYYLDDWLNTEPTFVLVGVFGGLLGSMYRLIRLSRRLDRLRRAEQGDAGH